MEFPQFHERLRAAIQLRENLVGGIPRTGDISVIEAWLKNQGLDFEAIAEIAETTAEEMKKQAVEEQTSGFKRIDDDVLCLEARCVNAMLKEVATAAGYTSHFKNPSLRQTLQHSTHVRPQRISLGVSEPKGTFSKPIHVYHGSAIKRADFVVGPLLTFEIWCLKTNRLVRKRWSEKDESLMVLKFKGFSLWQQIIFNLLVMGQEVGIGAWRTQYEGKFDLLYLEVHEEDGWKMLRDLREPEVED
jgi:hypothetical protein